MADDRINHNSRKRIFAAISILVSAGLIAFLLARMDWPSVAQAIRTANPAWLIAAALCILIAPPLMTGRWRGVLRAQEDDLSQLPFSVTLRAVLMASVLNSFLPSKAGDLAKAAYLRKQSGLIRGLGTVVLERMVDFIVLGLLGLCGWALGGVIWGLVAGLLLLGGVGALFALIAWAPHGWLEFSPKLHGAAQDFRRVNRRWIARPLAVAQTFACSLGIWTMCGVIVFCLAHGFGQPLSPQLALSIFPLAVLAGLMPATISGYGTRDAAFVALLASHAPREESTLIALGYSAIAYWLLALIGLPVVFAEIRAFLRKAKDTSNAE